MLERFPILKFYRGFSVTVIGMIPYAGTSFLVFGRMKTWLQTLIPPEEEVSKTSLSFLRSKTSVDLTAGALAGAISQTAAYPFEVVRRRQQVGGIIRPSSMLGVKETVGWIWKTSGWRGFYVGLSIGFLKVVPMTSIRLVETWEVSSCHRADLLSILSFTYFQQFRSLAIDETSNGNLNAFKGTRLRQTALVVPWLESQERRHED